MVLLQDFDEFGVGGTVDGDFLIRLHIDELEGLYPAEILAEESFEVLLCSGRSIVEDHQLLQAWELFNVEEVLEEQLVNFAFEVEFHDAEQLMGERDAHNVCRGFLKGTIKYNVLEGVGIEKQLMEGLMVQGDADPDLLELVEGAEALQDGVLGGL